MPNQRPLNPDEIAYYKSKGIDPSGFTAVDDEPAPQSASGDSYTQTAVKQAKAHAGGYVGGGLGAAGTIAALSWLAGPEVGLPTTLIAGALGAAGGGYAGQKGQEALEGKETASRLEAEAQQSAQENPKIATATDIVGSALAGGGKPNISNLKAIGSQLIGKNTLSAADKALVASLGKEAALGTESGLSSAGIKALANQQTAKQAAAKVGLSAVINPAVNSGVNYAITGQAPTAGDLASQVLGGALFSEQSALGRKLYGHGVSQDGRPVEPTADVAKLEGVPIDEVAPSIAERESPFTAKNPDGSLKLDDAGVRDLFAAKPKFSKEQDNISRQTALTQWRNKKALDAETMRQSAHEDWLKANPTLEPQGQAGPEAPVIPQEKSPVLSFEAYQKSLENEGDGQAEALRRQAKEAKLQEQLNARTSGKVAEEPVSAMQNGMAEAPVLPKVADAIKQTAQESLQRQAEFEKGRTEQREQNQAEVPFLEKENTKRTLNPETILQPKLNETSGVHEWLESMKYKNDGTTDFNTGLSAVKGIYKSVHNTVLDVVQKSIKAGKALNEAIKDGIVYAKGTGAKFDENEYSHFIKDELLKKNSSDEVKTDVKVPFGKVGKAFLNVADSIRQSEHPMANKLADAFKMVNNTGEQRTGQTWNKLHDTIEKLGGLTEQEKGKLNNIFEYENINRKAAPASMFSSNAKLRAAYDVFKSVHDESGEFRKSINQPVMRVDGRPSEFRKLPFQHPTAALPKVIETYRDGTDKAEIARLDSAYLANHIKYGKSLEEAQQDLATFKKAMQGSITDTHGNKVFFGGSRLAHNVPLPKEFTYSDPMKNAEAYYKRLAVDNAFYKHIESNHELMGALGATKDAWGKAIKADPDGSLMSNPHVKAALNSIQGEAQTKTSRVEGSISALATSILVRGPRIEWHKVTSNITNGPLQTADNPIQAARIIKAMITNIGTGIEHATENGVLKPTARSVSNFLDRSATWPERLAGLSKGIGDIVNPNDVFTKLSAGWTQIGYEASLPYKIKIAAEGNHTAQQLLKKFDPSYTIGKQYDAQGISELASRAVDYVHGTNDLRTMPKIMLEDTEMSGFLSLAHWSVSQTNKFYSDVYTPFRNGDYKPMMNALFGSIVGGYLINEMREKLGGKHSQIPDLKEIAAAKDEPGFDRKNEMYFYNAVAAASYAGFGGVFSQILKAGVDELEKNKPMGAVFPLDEILSDVVHQTLQAMSAYKNDPMSTLPKIASTYMTRLLTGNCEMARIVANHGVNEGLITGTIAEKKHLSDKMNQLRRYDMVSGLPVSEYEEGSNPYMNLEQKEFKREQDLGEAVQKLPKLISGIVDAYSSHPAIMLSKFKALKEEQYATFPSIESMPNEFMEYLAYLQRLHGPEEANAALSDYIRRNAINKAKSSMVP